MSQEQIKQARTIRRRRIQERQAVVFGVLILLLAAITLGALGVYTGAISMPLDRDFTVEEKPVDVQKPTPCLAPDTLPVPASKIKVQVLNASERSGLAAVVTQVLEDRNFVISGTGNAPEGRANTAIFFGINGVANAYTLAAHFPSSALILDEAREDDSVQVQLGQYFTSMVPTDEVLLEAETSMLPRDGCTQLWDLSDKVEAPKDTADKADEPEDAPADEAPADGATDEPAAG